ncbi:MAG: hypothetical protein IJF15_07295 [Oscillospiraceae bacterium]|nr:hypothetical protein [Oscillospiraceae bacterium]
MFMCAAFLLIGTAQTLFAVLSAALIHECAHLAVLRIFAVRIDRVRLGAFGAEIRCRARTMTYPQEILCALAGIAANLFFAALLARTALHLSWESGYIYAGAHLTLALFNALPVQPLDGGRALYLFCCWLWESVTAARICGAVGLVVGAVGVLFGAWLAFRAHGGCFLLIAALGIFLPQLKRSSA